MRHFLRILRAEARKQHRIYFHTPLVYFSMFIWPVLELVTAIYLFKPFNADGSASEILERNLGSGSVEGFLLIGFLGYNFFFSLIQSAWRFTSERFYGTLELILLTPANRFAVVLGNAAASLLESVWLFTAFAIAAYFYSTKDWSNANLMLLPLGLLALIVTALAWGTFLNSLFLLTRDAGLLYTILLEPLYFFGGVRFPTALFTTWMRIISYSLPLTYCLIILRKIVLFGGSFWDISQELVGLVILVTLMLTASYMLLGFAERRAKRKGTLTLF